jgi:hypothetical protein
MRRMIADYQKTTSGIFLRAHLERSTDLIPLSKFQSTRTRFGDDTRLRRGATKKN